MEPATFVRGPADGLRVVLVYCVLIPLATLGACLAFSVLLAWGAAWAGVSGGVVIWIFVAGFLAPALAMMKWGITRYRSWSIDRVTVSSDRLEVQRKGNKEEILFEELSLLRTEPWIVRLRTRKGTSLILRGPTWPMKELRDLLHAHAVPRMADRLVSCLDAGGVVTCGAPPRKAVLALFLGLVAVGLSVLCGAGALPTLKMGALREAVGLSLGFVVFLTGGVEGLRRFWGIYGHRIELDRSGIRLFSLPKWRHVPWAQARLGAEDVDGFAVQGELSRNPMRIENEIDNYEVVRQVIRRLGPASQTPG